MTWNEGLYEYARTHCLEYFGDEAEDTLLGAMTNTYDWNGILLSPEEPFLVQCKAYSAGRGGLGYEIRVLLRCTLDRDYFLEISGGNRARAGVNTVKRQLDKVSERFGVDLHDDYGCPEVTANRKIRTSDPAFTAMVFRDPEFRKMLISHPEFSLRAAKNAPRQSDDPRHLITVSAFPDITHWALNETEALETEEDRRRHLETFEKELDALIAAGKAALSALTAWRMPPKSS